MLRDLAAENQVFQQAVLIISSNHYLTVLRLASISCTNIKSISHNLFCVPIGLEQVLQLHSLDMLTIKQELIAS